MAISLRELPIFIQVLIFLALGVVIVVAGEYVPYFPLQKSRAELAQKTQQANTLHAEVTRLQDYDRRRAQLKSNIDALKAELENLKAIVPQDKEVDEFIRVVQGEAAGAGVSIRRLTAKVANPKEYYVELPFEMEADGPYYSVLDFFSRLGRVSRITNVADLSLGGIAEGKTKKFPLRPGTTVTGTFIVTTFYTKEPERPPAKQPGKQPGKG